MDTGRVWNGSRRRIVHLATTSEGRRRRVHSSRRQLESADDVYESENFARRRVRNSRRRVRDWATSGIGSSDDKSCAGTYGCDRATTGVRRATTGVAHATIGVGRATTGLRQASTGRGSGDNRPNPVRTGHIHSI